MSNIRGLIIDESFKNRWYELTGEFLKGNEDSFHVKYKDKGSYIKRYSTGSFAYLDQFNDLEHGEIKKKSRKKNYNLKPLEDLTELFKKAAGNGLHNIAVDGKYRGIDIGLLTKEGVFYTVSLSDMFKVLETFQSIEVKKYFLEANSPNEKADMVLPIYQGGELKNIQFRNSKREYLKDEKKILNLTGRDIALRGLDLLNFNETTGKKEVIFIVEGDFEYFTCRQHGYKAIAINSISNGKKLLDALEPLKSTGRLKGFRFVISFNKDKEGKDGALKASQQLKENLISLGLEAQVYNQFKADEDLNDMQMKDPATAKAFLEEAARQKEPRYYIKKYLTESPEVLEAIRTEKSLALISPCGSGKTYAVINTLKEDHQKFIFMVPNNSVKFQIAELYGIDACGHGVGLKRLLKSGSTQIVCCYESLRLINDISLLEGFTLVWDEYHTTLLDIHYRDNTEVLELVKAFDRTLVLTATPHKLIEFYDKKIIVESEASLNVEIVVVKAENERITQGQYHDFLKTVQEKLKIPTLLVFSSGVNNMEAIHDGEIITSDTKENDRLKSIIGGTLPEGLTVSTNLFNAGLSLYNSDEVCLIIDFKSYDVNKASYLQLINRFRSSKKIKVFVIQRNYKQSKATEETIREAAQDLINKMMTGEISIREVYTFNAAFERAIYFDNRTKEFKFDEDKGLKIAEQIINGYKESAEEVIEGLSKCEGWDYKGIYTIKELGTILDKDDKPKEKKPKAVLKELFITKGEVNQFAKTYFMSRLTEEKHDYNKQWLDRDFKSLHMELIKAMRERAVRNAVQALLKGMIGVQDVKPALNKYFKVHSKFDLLEYPKEKLEAVRAEILSYGKDNYKYSKTRLVLSNHFPAFIPNRTITADKQVKELLSYLDIKPKKDGETSNKILLPK